MSEWRKFSSISFKKNLFSSDRLPVIGSVVISFSSVRGTWTNCLRLVVQCSSVHELLRPWWGLQYSKNVKKLFGNCIACKIFSSSTISPPALPAETSKADCKTITRVSVIKKFQYACRHSYRRRFRLTCALRRAASPATFGLLGKGRNPNNRRSEACQ